MTRPRPATPSKTEKTGARSSLLVPALEGREDGHVEDGVGDADDDHRRERDGRVGQQPDDRDRSPPVGQRHALRPDQLVGPRHRRREDGSAEAAHSEGRAEQADPGVTHSEELDRGHDHERVQHPTRHHLGEGRDDRPARHPAPTEGPQTIEQPDPAANPPGAAGRVRGLLEAKTGHGCHRDRVAGGGCDCHARLEAGGNQQAGDERAGKGPEPFTGGPGHVRGDELPGAPGDRRHQRHLDRPDRSAGGRGDPSEADEEQGRTP